MAIKQLRVRPPARLSPNANLFPPYSSSAYLPQVRPQDAAAFAPALRRELRALARVQHPNVVRLYGVWSHPIPRVVLPLADGSLRDAILEGAVPPTVALLCGIARGMAAIHAHAILHLDLKPENVLLSHGEPWITDFGLATSQAIGSTSAISSVAARGTMRYKAPELFRTRRQGGPLVSAAADVYAYALVAWELVGGEVPWLGMSDAEVIANVMDGERPMLHSGEAWEAKAPAELWSLITACWASDETRTTQDQRSARPTFAGILTSLEEMHDTPTATAATSSEARAPTVSVATKVEEPREAKGRDVDAPTATPTREAPPSARRASREPTLLAQLRCRIADWTAPQEEPKSADNTADRLEEMELTIKELRSQIAAFDVARIASEAERVEVREEVAALRVALSIAESDASRLERLAGDAAVAHVRQMVADVERSNAELQARTQAMLHSMEQQLSTALADSTVDCPKMPWVQGGAGGRYRLFFVCPVALEVRL